MNRIKLVSLIIKNFKGIKYMVLTFTDLTNIKGENGTGKTTIFDAFTWLLLDKDSMDRQSFEIKTLDSNNRVIHGLDHEVTGIINVNGREIKLTKILREKWTKKKGEAERQFTGHETLYYIDEVPVLQSQFKAATGKFMNEQLFKLISNPLYFSMNMKWQDRRKVLIDIIGDIPAERVINYRKNLGTLADLLKDKDIDTLKKSLAVKKRKLNEDIKAIPIRIDESNKALQEFDFNSLEEELFQFEESLKEMEEKLLNFSKINEGFLEDKKRLYALKTKIQDIEERIRSEKDREKRELEYRVRNCNYEISSIIRNIEEEKTKKDNLSKKIETLEKTNEVLKAKWYEIKDSELIFNENEFICPTCYRAFEEKDIERKKAELKANFQGDKENNLRRISQEGKENNIKIEEWQGQLRSAEMSLISLKEKLSLEEGDKEKAVEALKNFVYSVNLEEEEEYRDLKEQAEALEKVLSNPVEDSMEISSIKEERGEIISKIDECKKKLAAREQNEKINRRILELKEEERALALQIAELEGQEFLCEEYTKAKVELMEASINSKFKLVKFKMFNTLVNGAVEDCCEALINGVPFSNANKASQINGGLDIINALCQHYGVEAPIFIDNREGINSILDSSSQIINLIVTRDKELEVEDGKKVKVSEEEKAVEEKEEEGPGF